MKSMDVAPCRSVLDLPFISAGHLTILPAYGEHQAQEWRDHCHAVQEPQVL